MRTRKPESVDGPMQLATPSVSLTITIIDPDGNTIISAVAMTEESEGIHVYNYDTNADASNGNYSILYISIDTASNLQTISRGAFTVEDK